jgi:3-oxoacyl-[acyl-carrier protein] reductase
MFQFNGQKALVTGATGAIGGAIARALHARGADVILSGTRESVLQQLCNELKERAHVIPCDLGQTQAVEELFPQAEAQVGPIDIIVNNAGVTRDNLIIRMKDEDWQTVIDINLSACFRLCRAAAKAMMKRRYGRIINITSVVGVTGNPGQANYCAAKAGLIGLSKSLAQEIASRGITVNCIAPGFIASSMTEVLPEAVKDKIKTGIPMGRMGTPEEIAGAAVFLASQEAAYITGQTLHVNGGMAMI